MIDSAVSQATYTITGGTETPDVPDTPEETDAKAITKGITATASGSESDAMAAKYAVDGNTGTRWSSNFADDAWITLALGKHIKLAKLYLTGRVLTEKHTRFRHQWMEKHGQRLIM